MNEWIYIDILYIIIYGYIYIYYIYTYIVCHNVKSIISYTIYCRRSSEFSYITYHSRNIGSPPGVDAALLWEKVAESCLGLRCLSAVGGFSPPLWKMMEWKSDGMMKFPTERKVIKFMFQSPPTSYSTPMGTLVPPGDALFIPASFFTVSTTTICQIPGVHIITNRTTWNL